MAECNQKKKLSIALPKCCCSKSLSQFELSPADFRLLNCTTGKSNGFNGFAYIYGKIKLVENQHVCDISFSGRLQI